MTDRRSVVTLINAMRLYTFLTWSILGVAQLKNIPLNSFFFLNLFTNKFDWDKIDNMNDWSYNLYQS